jgi:hyperosmotically inducible periplasmic protein
MRKRWILVVAVAVALCACGRVGTEGKGEDGRAIHVERGAQGTEIEFNPGVARRNADQAGRDLERSADQAGRALQRGAREAGEKLGPAARKLGAQLQQGAREIQTKAGPAAREAGRELQQGAQKVGAELAPAARQAGDALARGARQVGDQVGPAVRRAAADAALSATVKAKLIADPEVKATKIDVSTVDGVVTLSGRVETTAEHAAALRVAKGTDGVHRIVDALQVGPG